MSNIFNPNGFTPARLLNGAAWTGQLVTRKIAAANTHKFYKGDPIIALSTGYIDGGAGINPAGLPTQGVWGIFWGCKQPASATVQSPWNAQYNGTAQAADTEAYIILDPFTVFRAWVGTGASSAAGGPATIADVGANFNFQLGSGNTLSGLSGAYIDYAQTGTTPTLPFSMVGTVETPPGVNGTDVASVGNLIEVVLNQSAFKVGTTGI